MKRLTNIALLSGALASLAGCGADPASEEPVMMVPGEYRVTISGSRLAGFLETLEGTTEKSFCMRPRFIREIQERVVRGFLEPHEDCGNARFEREGNALYGSTRCTDRVLVSEGTITWEFDGAVEAERVSGDISMDIEGIDGKQLGVSESALNRVRNMEIDFEAVRIGDCT